jgi:hypothetical protein
MDHLAAYGGQGLAGLVHDLKRGKVNDPGYLFHQTRVRSEACTGFIKEREV